MKAFSVRELKNNPSVALRAAREHPVIVLNRHQPEAVLIHLDDESLLSEPGVRCALATALYRDRSLSLGQAARFSGFGTAAFIQHSVETWHPGGTRKRRYHKRGHRSDRRMADRFVAADASPLIGLATAGAFHLLKELFGRVRVTPAVRSEVLAGGSLPGASELAAAIASAGSR